MAKRMNAHKVNPPGDGRFWMARTVSTSIEDTPLDHDAAGDATASSRQRQVMLARLHRGQGFIRPALFNNLIRPQQQRRRDGKAERFGGLEVDDVVARRCVARRDWWGEARRRGAARARALRARRSPLAFLAQELERMRAKVSRQVKTP
jgi:hypothetical protein